MSRACADLAPAARHPLERLLSPLDPVAVDDPSWDPRRAPAGAAVRCRPGSGPAELMRAGDWWLFARPAAADPRATGAGGSCVERFELPATGAVLDSRRSADGTVIVPFGLAEAYAGYTAELWAQGSGGRGLPPWALDAYYRVKGAIPRRVQLAARRALIRRQGTPRFPAWPFDAGVAALLRFYVRCIMLARGQRELRFRWLWPGRARAAVILTHDVESAAGLRNAPRIADLEQARGLRSSFNIVADGYPIDWGIVEELRDRGFELGVHGVFHDRSMFSARDEFEAQQPALRAMAERLGASGFRSPATHRVAAWLAELPVDYDCTIPMSDCWEPQPGGCCSPWPFFLGRVVELPYTAPQDHTLLTLLGERSIATWLRQLDAIEGVAGLAQFVTHPDPGYLGDPRNEALYAELLDAIAARERVWRALPREVADWWRRRDRAGGEAGADGLATLTDDGTVTLAPDHRPGARLLAAPPPAIPITPARGG